jgi:Ser/Thr protein kinase RdoA (MazF antagonist)
MLMGEVRGDDPNGLPPAEWAPALRTLAEIHAAWSGRSDELLALGAQDRRVGSALPETLVHGDLNPGNVLLADGRAVIFDWSDACVADPIVDVALLLFQIEDEAARAVLLDAYADARSLPRSELRAIFAASEANAYLHQAESYRAICDALAPDDRWWFEDEEELWRGWASDVLAGRRPNRGT